MSGLPAAQPFFGPPESAAIFAAKWVSKFRELLHRIQCRVDQQDTPQPIWMCVSCVEVVDHIRVFYAQARQLSLGPQDYPPRVGSLTESDRPKTTCDNVFEKMKDNPFECSKLVILMVDQMALEMRMVKLGGAMRGLLNWQALPLRWRQVMNEQFLLIDKGRAEGWWGVPDGAREEMKRNYEQKLKDLPGRQTFRF